MPTPNWLGKDKVVNRHPDVPYTVLQHPCGFDVITLKGEATIR
ncbi:MAG: hypothetical protein ACOH13_12590 [Flavobacteriales bacterium]